MSYFRLSILIFLLGCRTIAPEGQSSETKASFNFHKMSEVKKRGNSGYGKYAWDKLIRYRGTQEEVFGIEQALEALAGNKNIYVESRLFSTIKFKLMRKSHQSWFVDPRKFHIDHDLQNLLKKRSQGRPKQYSKREASKLAKRLVDLSFERLEKKVGESGIIGTLIDYDSPNYVDWPANVIFTTVIQSTAGNYGPRTIVVDEKPIRSVDLNNWNKVKNNHQVFRTRDYGEYITPGYLFSKDMVGYQIRLGDHLKYFYIDYGLYLHEEDGRRHILVFDGRFGNYNASEGAVDRERLSACMLTSRYDYHHCHVPPAKRLVYDTQPLLKKATHLGKEMKMGLIGTISECKSGNCSPPTKFISKHKVLSNRTFYGTFKSKLDSFLGKRKNYKFHRADQKMLVAKKQKPAPAGAQPLGPSSACVSSSQEEVFTTDLVGCSGAVTFSNRDSLCASGWKVCQSDEWKRYQDSGTASEPSHIYWLANSLNSSKDLASGRCAVTDNLRYGRSCKDIGNGQSYTDSSMGVCPQSKIDPSGNSCYKSNCGFWNADKNYYFGGCVETAGTLCCR